jgi:ABC-type transporter Mla MlaB component
MTQKRTAAPRKSRRSAATPEDVPSPPAPRVDIIDLGSSCTLPDVAALRLACIAALEAKSPPVLDGARVERVDAAGIQVLVGFTIDCMERSVDFSWAGRSPQLARAIRLLGVDALLESPGIATPMGGVA